MKQCPNCRIDYSDSCLFCAECGASLAEVPPLEPAAPPADSPFGPAEPTIQIPPIPPVPPANSPAAAPSPPMPPVKKKGMIPAGFIAIPTAFALLFAAAAVFFGISSFRYKENYESEQAQRLDAGKEASDIQAQLDKLQLDYDKQAAQLEDKNRQLDDTRNQLEDVSGQLTDGSSRLDEVENELNSLIDMLDSGYGFGSTSYYAAKGVVVVRQYGSESVAIYEDMAGEVSFTYHTPGNGISCQWDGESFSGGRNSVTITGGAPGYYILSFTNDRNSDAFDILVIVTAD